MAEFSGVAQTVQPNETITYSIVNVPCYRGLVMHDPSSGNFLLKGALQNGGYSQRCCCKKNTRDSLYLVSVGANIAVPEGQTVGEISIAIAVDGGTLSNTTMRATPAAVEEFANVSRTTNVSIFSGCCQTVTVKNTSTIPILVSEPNIVFQIA